MAVMRIHKNKNYTVISNVHLRDKRISLKAKGLLTLMLSLPEDWDYSVEGLSSICKREQNRYPVSPERAGRMSLFKTYQRTKSKRSV